MHFVVQAEVDDGLLQLHNMTKEMVLLSKEEQRVFEHCPTDLECYAEMPEMYEHMLQQDMKAMYQDYLEKGVTNR